jgi:hypothetical protein
MTTSGIKLSAKMNTTEGIKAAVAYTASPALPIGPEVFEQWCFFITLTRITKKNNLFGKSGIFWGTPPAHLMEASDLIKLLHQYPTNLLVRAQITTHPKRWMPPELLERCQDH